MYKVTVNEQEARSVEFENDSSDKGKLNEDEFQLDVLHPKKDSFHILMNDRSFSVDVLEADHDEKTFKIQVNGNVYIVGLKDRYDLLLERLGMEDLQSQKEKEVKAPMPGLVLDIKVQEGQEVSKGEAVLVLEAMKMENVIKAPTDGVVKSVNVSVSNPVEKNAVLIEFE